ncbi:MAG: hypothetical protein OXG27_00765 [Chloroflexi bacterium]|nr:hypothetical protein [Chloroflexota bacterium]
MRWALGVLAVALMLGAMAATGVIAQSDSGYEVRVRAMRLVDGRTEFEIQQKHQDGSWSDSLFSRNPRLSSNPAIERWYSSSGVALVLQQDSSMQLVEESIDQPQPAPEEGVEAEAPWSPLGDTGGRIDIQVDYEVKADPLTGSLETIISARTVRDDFYELSLTVICDGDELELVANDSRNFTVNNEQVTIRAGDTVQSETWGTITRYWGDVSPENDSAWYGLLRNAESATVRVGEDGVPYVVHLAGFFDTPAQGNIDRCGAY